MKTIKLAAILLFFPFTIHAQTLTGLWIGNVSNDSSTVRKDQSFELVLTQYRNKVYGYSRSTFIVNDTLYYVVKRVKGTIEGDVCEVKDVEIVSYNFKGRADKGVKMTSTFRFDPTDSLWKMDGTWKTNKTKKFYSVSGKMDLKTEPDVEKSKIIPHLEELKLAEEVAVYQEAKVKKEAEMAAIKKQETRTVTQSTKENKPAIASTQPVKKEQPAGNATAKTEVASTTNTTAIKNQGVTVDQQNTSAVASQPVKNEKTETAATSKQPPAENKNETASISIKKEPVAVQDQPRTVKTEAPVAAVNSNAVAATSDVKKDGQKPEVKQEVAKTNEPVAVAPAEQKTEAASTETVPARKMEQTTAVIRDKPVAISNASEAKPVITAPKAAVFVEQRKMAAQQTVFFKSDSLELALYDNGEIDGDTVSILLNGELILAKQGLKASAIKKTIYVPSGKTDSLMLVLYAENLGKYPPNTGLMVVHDGDDTYQVRFSATLQQNAAVVFKRKRE